MEESLSADTTISHYRIVSRLGAGGMGEVYLAEDTKLDRKVALKILPGEVAADQERMRRFVQEAKAAAALNHPNIAHIYEIGETDGINFIAMEFIDGQTLREYTHKGEADLGKLLRHLQHIAAGLAQAHSAGIIHRDLKPDNVMVTREGHAKILDFGLAKLIEPQQTSGASSEDVSEEATAILQQQSTPGTILGTAGYMSPEQAQGRTKEIDHRSDIFSFGCILFEAVTGHRAFEGKDSIDTLNKIIREPVAPISNFRPDAPNHLQRIVRRCLAKDPEDRYQTIKDVVIELRELRRELAGRAAIDTTVPPPSDSSTVGSREITTSSGATRSTSSSAEYVVTRIKQHKLAAAIAVVAVAIGAAGLGIYLRARSSEATIDSIAVLPFVNASADPNSEYLSDGIAENLINSISRLPKLRVMARSTVFRYKGREVEPQTVGRELKVRAVLTGRVVQRGDILIVQADLVDVTDGSQLWGERYNRKLADIFAIQEEISREISEKLRLRLTGEEQNRLGKRDTENTEAYQLYLKGRFYWNKRTPEGIRKASEYLQQAIELDPNYALAYAGLADCYVVPANPLPPREKMPKAKAAAMKALQIDDTLAEAHTSLARALAIYDWDWPGAEKQFQRALELNPRYPIAHQWYGSYFMVLGRDDESIAERRRAQELDPLSLTINFELGLAFYYARSYDLAIEQFQKTLEMDPNFPLVYQFLPAAYEQEGRYDEAIAGFQKAITLPAGDEWTNSMGGLGHVYAVSGKKGEAQKVLNELKQLSGQRYISANYIALIYAGLGEKDQAFRWLEKAYEEHSFGMASLKVEPRWDSLRSDPRFTDLLRRTRLAP